MFFTNLTYSRVGWLKINICFDQKKRKNQSNSMSKKFNISAQFTICCMHWYQQYKMAQIGITRHQMLSKLLGFDSRVPCFAIQVNFWPLIRAPFKSIFIYTMLCWPWQRRGWFPEKTGQFMTKTTLLIWSFQKKKKWLQIKFTKVCKRLEIPMEKTIWSYFCNGGFK